MNLTLTQKQTLSPTVQTSMYLLKLNNVQLRSYIYDLMHRNAVVELTLPVLEYDPDPFCRCSAHISNDKQADSRNSWLEEQPEESNYLHDLFLQAAVMKLNDQEAQLVHYLILSLDENGFLTESPASLSEDLSIPEEDVRHGIALLQRMEPCGIGASNLSECLRLQLLHSEPVDRLALKIVDFHLEKMAAQQYAALAKLLQVPKADVVRACDHIRTLSPKPLNGTGRQEDNHYIIPDFYITENEGQLHCTMNDYFLPKITIESTYQSMLQDQSLRPEEKEYIQEKCREATEVSNFITYRKSTMLRMMEYVLEIQKDFFIKGPGYRVSMSNAEIAEALSLHESTISRTVTGKFFECQWGVFPLKSLFSRSINKVESDFVLKRLQELIQTEPAGHAYSDQQLTDLLSDEGIQIARRTVVKYRQSLGIPSSHQRNKQRTEP